MQILFDAEGNYTDLALSLDAMIDFLPVKEIIDYAEKNGYDMRHAEYIVSSGVTDRFICKHLDKKYNAAIPERASTS